MQTVLADFIRDTPDGAQAEEILRRCVHCGFCTATCPTYQLLGDELDGPRGRIYLIKEMFEGQPVSRVTQQHLDRCLTCRACETTCPSGVEYGKLADIGRKHIEQRVPRPWRERVVRRMLMSLVLSPRGFAAALGLGRLARPLLPRALRDKVPQRRSPGAWPARSHPRKMLLLAGCVQPAMMPNINAATARVLDALGVELIVAPDARCCGAIRQHLGETEAALDDMRRNIDAWWPYVEQGVEALIMNASGCGVTVKEYAWHLRHDTRYREKAARISALTRDLAEVLPAFEEALRVRMGSQPATTIAFHSPCTLQHGQRLQGRVERLLRALGFDVRVPVDAHACCGSAGTYSILQPELAEGLRARKLAALTATEAPLFVSANIGCIAHLQAGTTTPTWHWIELIDQCLRSAG